jgi:DNA-binding CsgD family transcriptional regulator
MLLILGYTIFIVSVAMATGGVILSSRLRSRIKHDLSSSLLYYQVFIYTFGFYGIWGQVLIRSYLKLYISDELIVRFTDVAILLGLPFLVFAWLMLMRLTFIISGRTVRSWMIIVFLAVNFVVLTITGYYTSRSVNASPASILKYYFIIMNSIYAISIFLILLTRGGQKTELREKDSKTIADYVPLIMIIQSIPLVFYSNQEWIAFIFIILFFTGNTFIPIFLTYGAQTILVDSGNILNLSFEDFCKKYDISPREKDIIREISNGLSNKEISDKLFISLQTVKDHTHRIYTKVNVRNRVQLINILKTGTDQGKVI